MRELVGGERGETIDIKRESDKNSNPEVIKLSTIGIQKIRKDTRNVRPNANELNAVQRGQVFGARGSSPA